MKKIAFILSFFLIYGFTSLAAEFKKIINLADQESKVEFQAIGKPSIIKISGTGGKVKGQLQVVENHISGDLSVLLQPMTTGISMRDNHMKEKYLEVSKFPEATLSISDMALEKNVFTNEGHFKSVPFKGKLKIHGIEKEIQGYADIDSTKDTVTVLAQTKASISDYKMDIPTYMSIKVADDVNVTAELKIKKQ